MRMICWNNASHVAVTSDASHPRPRHTQLHLFKYFVEYYIFFVYIDMENDTSDTEQDYHLNPNAVRGKSPQVALNTSKVRSEQAQPANEQRERSSSIRLESIPGMGSSTLKQIRDLGYTTLEDMMKPEIFDTLPKETRLYLTYRPQRRISHDDMAEFVRKIPNYVVIAGSFRREVEFLGDLDIIVREERIRDFECWLARKEFHEINSGDEKKSGYILTKIGYIRLDICYTSRENFVFMLLHFTGSVQENIIMRKIAKDMGMKLNQYGLYDVDGKKILAESERDVYDTLGISYKLPTQRH
jgi:DNA polymerase/3'-5' exonuclease PolX